MKGKAKKIVLAVLVMAVLSALGGCMILAGEDGAVYGAYDWSYGTLIVYEWEDSGFPNPIENSDWGTYYSFQPGSYSFRYQIYSSGYYYPTYSTAYNVEYVVTANEGELFADGDDKYFDLWLTTAGWTDAGLSIKGMGVPSVQPDGTQIYTTGGYTISMKVTGPVSVEGEVGQTLTK